MKISAKNSFLKATLLVVAGMAFVFGMNAQTNSGNESKTGMVTVNINLSSIQSLVINTAQQTVDINYTTAANYKEGVSVTQNDHLIAFSTGGYSISVQSDGDFKSGTDNIPASDVTVKATAGTGNDKTSTFAPIKLGTTGGKIITSAIGTGGDLKFNVEYDNKAEATDNYKTLNTANSTKTYTAKVTYTIAPA